jgi:hypothetical protein
VVRRRYAYLVAGLAAVVVAIAVVVLLAWSGMRGNGPRAADVAGRVAGDQADVAAVVRLLTTLPAHAAVGDTGDLAPSLHVIRAATLRRLLPPGSVITTWPTTWRRTGAVASITIVLRRPGQGRVRYVAVLFRERGGWRLAQTFPWAPAVTGTAASVPAGG